MIKATTLRLKNEVLYRGSILSVAAINMQGSYYGMSLSDSTGKIYHAQEEEVDGIHLTTEWLKKCGMELRKEDKIWQIQIGNTSYLEIEAEEPFMCGVTPETWRDICPIYIWNEIKHVHQLQNLYFALTGEELTIKM